ncbi:PREDICTED: uncharacterized protein LOC109180033 [Ipomoea nil]|uniref:uncharacterized protein LOC109180033 n=1 Tax=Ipomoea nil TaxID=35883 RepID=UPI0009011830|nr:PREDICTED: uncharacterized protein LOC109180033 [Ipomoea nil]
MAVWVRLPRLAAEYFRDDVIKSILEGVGKPLQLDRTTAAVVKGRYARAVVEVDLDKPLVMEIWVEDQLQIVEYESLHVVCFGCGMIGHREQSCPLSKEKNVNVNEMDLNETPVAEEDGESQQMNANDVPPKQHPSTTPAHSPTIPVRVSRHGPWMLVTNKKADKQHAKNNRQNKQHNRQNRVSGNQFELLANLETSAGDSQPLQPVVRSSTERGESSREVGDGEELARAAVVWGVGLVVEVFLFGGLTSRIEGDGMGSASMGMAVDNFCFTPGEGSCQSSPRANQS